MSPNNPAMRGCKITNITIKNKMTYPKSIFILLFSLVQLTVSAQNNALFGLLRTPNPPAVYLGKLDLGTNTFDQISPSSLATSYNLTGAALDPNTGSYFYVGNESLFSVNILMTIKSILTARRRLLIMHTINIQNEIINNIILTCYLPVRTFA